LFQHSGLYKNKFQKTCIQNLSTAFCFLLCSYLLVGAAIFDALESNTEDLLRKQYQVAEAGMLQTYNISHNEYIELEDIVIKYQPHKAGAQWKFPGAFYFSLTVITTIGKKYLSI
jgi:potassium channel subfamily K protein 9